MTRSAPVVSLLLLALCAAPAAAQALRVESEVRHPAAAAVDSLVARGDYLLIDRDTVLGPETRIPRDVVVVDATVRLEGTVEGSAALVHGSLFLRPGARVAGRVASVNGYFLPSARAQFGDSLSLPLEASTRLERSDGTYVLTILRPAPRPVLRPRGAFGVVMPAYDRVNALTARWTAGLALGTDSMAPELIVSAAYRTARESLGGRATLVTPLGHRTGLTLAAGRETRTNERWIRGDLVNSAAAFFVRSDARDYRDSDFASLTLAGRRGKGLTAGEGFLLPRLTLLASRDRSLRARDVYSLFDRDDAWRPNPEVLNGWIVSAAPGATVAWRGATTRFTGDAALEVGTVGESDPLIGQNSPYGDFAQLTVDGRWEMTALWGHTLSFRAHYLQPVGGEIAPPQRWSFVGGPATLPTFEYSTQRGDHLVFLGSTYGVPLRRVSVPLLGPPSLVVTHAVGAAWVTGAPMPRWLQNLGAGLQFSFAYAYLYIDPADVRSPELSLGLSLP